MIELQMTDAEVQKLVAPAIRKHLRKAGFKTGIRSDESGSYLFPIDLQLAGDVSVHRSNDGIWTFRQEESAIIADRMAQMMILHAEAISAREERR